MQINILDCTLRDGGYNNNWEFNNKAALNIISSLIKAKVDIVECGFLSQKKGKEKDATQFDDINTLNNLLVNVNGNSKYVAMINLGEYDLESLPQCLGKVSGIRLAFHKENVKEALEAGKIIIDKGYDLFVQAMVTLAYTDEEILDLIKELNVIKPYAMYIVDSFGAMSKEEFKHFFNLFNENLDKDIKLGFHAHNNTQLAYSIAIDFIGMNNDRDIIIDSAIFGMGRGAGNLNTELLANYLNKNMNREYNIIPLLEVIDSYLESIYRETYWGFSIAHFLSAIMNCHQNYAGFLLNKKNLSMVAIYDILNSIDISKRRGYDEGYIKKKYLEYKSKRKKDINVSQDFLIDKKILLLASGTSVKINENEIKEHIKDHTVVSVNHIPDNFDIDYCFFSNQKRYDEFVDKIDNSKLIITSNIDVHSNHDNCFVIDYEKLVSSNKCDNVAILFLNFLINQSVKNVDVAGLDGYDISRKDQFSYKEHGRILDKEQMEMQNKMIGEAIKEISSKIRIHFITKSIFEKELPMKILGVIPARYKSSRFEGKPLAMIKGIPMIKRTYMQAKKSLLLDHLVVATDDNKIFDFCTQERIPVVMTSEDCLTGTDRIAEVASKMDYDLYINIQGDEPVISPETINQIVEVFKKDGDKYVAYNLYKEMDDEDEVKSNASIKVIVDHDGKLMYMSRLPVPFSKSGKDPVFFKQVCVYGFTKKALEIFSGRDKTQNEQFEDIEILRFLDLGHNVKMIKTDFDSIAVDFPEDVKKVEEFLEKNGLE